jgi:hypothetical protein
MLEELCGGSVVVRLRRVVRSGRGFGAGVDLGWASWIGMVSGGGRLLI